MSAEIKEATDVTVVLNPGGNGIFDVKLDGVIIFSKYQFNRFPEEGEIAGLLAKTKSEK